MAVVVDASAQVPGARTVTISGRAYYAGGGERTLVPTTFDTLTIAITTEMFR